jgi:hypothetical protein
MGPIVFYSECRHSGTDPVEQSDCTLSHLLCIKAGALGEDGRPASSFKLSIGNCGGPWKSLV